MWSPLSHKVLNVKDIQEFDKTFSYRNPLHVELYEDLKILRISEETKWILIKLKNPSKSIFHKRTSNNCLFRTLSKVKIFRKSVKNMAQVYFIIELSTANPYSTYTQFKKNLFKVLSTLLSTEISHNGLNHLKLNHPIFISYSGFC